MAELKPISKEAIPQALAKATRYRLLNEPEQAESICHDVLAADPSNQDAIYTLVLCQTDRFGTHGSNSLNETLKLTEQLTDAYHRDYARGIIYERHAGVSLESNSPQAGYIAYENLQQAMNCFEKAEKVRPEKNEDPILRWNACVRMIEQHRLRPSPDDEQGTPLGE